MKYNTLKLDIDSFTIFYLQCKFVSRQLYTYNLFSILFLILPIILYLHKIIYEYIAKCLWYNFFIYIFYTFTYSQC